MFPLPDPRIAACLLCLVLTACATPSVTLPQTWESPRGHEHPLTGRVWRAGDGRFIPVDTLAGELREAPLMLLGEKHDNPDHHRLRLALVESLIRSPGLGSLSLEMLTGSQVARLDEVDTRALAEQPERLRRRLQWQEGWHWPFYAPVLRAALRAGVPIRAANLDEEEMTDVYGGELPEEAAGALDEAQRARLREQIRISHCDRLPEEQLPAMVRVQQARDLRMAQSLEAGSGRPRVLLAGNFHVRRDLGVTNYLDDSADAVTVAFMEVSPSQTDPRDYLDTSSPETVFDYVWFTPSLEEQDYCAGL